MTPAQVDLIIKTCETLYPMTEQAGKMFYNKLFKLDPDLERLFENPIENQINKFFLTIELITRSLHDISEVFSYLEQLGIQNLGFGVKNKDYETAGKALMWTLEQSLKDDFTPEVEAAWAMSYTTISNIMKDAAHKEKSK